MEISEIFFSIQGESTTTGFPCLFIRFFGCNLSCPWCDTKYAVQHWVKDPREGKDYHSMSVDEILDVVNGYGVKYVCLTGGEPLIQRRIKDLVRKLGEKEYQIEIRTNGTVDLLPLRKLSSELRIVMDMKCPGSGMEKVKEQTVVKNFKSLGPEDEAVFVLVDKGDYDYAKDFIGRYQTQATVNFSSVFDKLPYSKLAEWVLKDRLPVRLNLQIHKFIWGANKRGV